jgi:RNA polymerase sigma factor (sigma-70 family)
MAQYTPKGWKASPESVKAFTADHVAIRKLVAQRARKYFALSGIDPADLIQEGMIAALYALDSYKQERGKRDAYLQRVLDNAFAMVACEARAQCRQPYVWVQVDEEIAKQVKRTSRKLRSAEKIVAAGVASGNQTMPTEKHSTQGWRRVPWLGGAGEVSAVDPDEIEGSITLSISEQREEVLEQQERVFKSRQKLLRFRSKLRPEVAAMLDLKLNPPMDLLVLARNHLGRTVSLKSRMPNSAIASYLGMDVDTVAKAVRELREVLNAEYKVNV